VIELPVTIHGKGVPTWETHQAKIDHDDSVAGPGQHFGGDCADGWFAKSNRTSIDELAPAISSAPVGHRQPHADQVPSEKNLMDPNDPSIARTPRSTTINGICRGC
jgi:hypothetical protein